MWDRNHAMLNDFIEVFGMVNLLSESGYPIYTWLPLIEGVANQMA
jgi:hypothetical protein